MEPLFIVLLASTFLNTLMAGIVLTFAIIVMPGIKRLSDQDYLETFKSIDRIIQNGHPIFMTIWLGSSITLVLALAMGWGHLSDLNLSLLGMAALFHLGGVQLPTIVINVPANNHLQATDLVRLNTLQISKLRRDFEPVWVRWNRIRTVAAMLTGSLLLVLLVEL